MPMAALLPLLMVGGSAAAGALSNRSKTSTTTSTPSWTPEQQHMQELLGNVLQYDINDPGKGLEPLKTSAINGVNQTYNGIGDRMDTQLASRGFERSGTAVKTARATEFARAGAIGGVENHFAGMELDQKNRLLQMMQQFGFASPGQNTTSTQPGNMLGGAVSGGLETASLLFALNKLGKGGGGSYGMGDPEI
jgi:hypothetical protein